MCGQQWTTSSLITLQANQLAEFIKLISLKTSGLRALQANQLAEFYQANQLS
jgi:hypothetical protein